MNIAKVTSRRTGELVKPSEKKVSSDDSNSVIYKIPCSGCTAAYYGESARGLDKRIYEHKNDMKAHRASNSLVVHAEKFNHLPDWRRVEILHKGYGKFIRRVVGAAYISTENVTNHRSGFINLARAASMLTVREATETKGNNNGPGAAIPRRPAR